MAVSRKTNQREILFYNNVESAKEQMKSAGRLLSPEATLVSLN
jgi:hypothetical protein